MSQLLASGGQSIGPSASALVLPMTGLISFRIDWFDLLAVPGTLKSLIQHHSLKPSILWWSAFIMVQLSYPYLTTGKTIALTIRTFVSVMPSKSIHIAANDKILFFFLWLSSITLWVCVCVYGASQVVLVIKNPLANAIDTRDTGLIPGSGKIPGVGSGNPL